MESHNKNQQQLFSETANKDVVIPHTLGHISVEAMRWANRTVNPKRHLVLLSPPENGWKFMEEPLPDNVIDMGSYRKETPPDIVA